MRLHTWITFAALMVCLSGCGESYSPVSGYVQLPDGSPLRKGLIVFSGTANGESVSARGYIQPDGSFALVT